MYVVDPLYKAHGYEDIAYHVVSIYQACLHLVEAWISRLYVLLLDLRLIVFLASGTIVGLLSWLRLCLRCGFYIRYS